VLFRRGRPLAPESSDPPVFVNPGTPARDVAVVQTAAGLRLAVVNAASDSVTLYARRSDGRFAPDPVSLPTGRGAVRIAVGDLDGDGHDDLAVLNAGTGTVSLFRASASGGFTKWADLPVGLGGSDLVLARVEGTGPGLDLLVANQVSGEVNVLVNDGLGHFSPVRPYRAGNGLNAFLRSDPAVRSVEGITSALAEVVKSVGGPAQVVLEALGVPAEEGTVTDLGKFAADLARGLLEAGQDIAATVFARLRERLKVEAPTPALGRAALEPAALSDGFAAGAAARADALEEAPLAREPAGEKDNPPREEVTVPRPEGVLDHDRGLSALLVGTVFTAGLYAFRGREKRRSGDSGMRTPALRGRPSGW